VRQASGEFTRTGKSFAVRSFAQLVDAEPTVHEKQAYLQTRGKDAQGRALWVKEADATVIVARDKYPIGVKEGEKWIILSITSGTLVAYEGLEPVFATLQSPGAGGVPMRGRNPVKMSTTPMGVYRVTFKHRAATMSPEQGENRSFWIADVPYTQYFNAPFALHTAYWHESFGELMSAGCVNLSPRDGRTLFEWTDPKVPPEWNGAGPVGPLGPGTYVVVTR
jgi:lipoprotein-anchoring transpeptidase ErfK/SrfK